MCQREKAHESSAHGRFFPLPPIRGVAASWLIQNKHSYIRVCELRRVSIESSVRKLFAVESIEHCGVDIDSAIISSNYVREVGEPENARKFVLLFGF